MDGHQVPGKIYHTIKPNVSTYSTYIPYNLGSMSAQPPFSGFEHPTCLIIILVTQHLGQGVFWRSPVEVNDNNDNDNSKNQT